MATRPTALDVRSVPLERLHLAPWNANVVPAATLAKVRRSIAEFGIVENLVARTLPNPCPHCRGVDHLEVVSGNHRLEIYSELGLKRVPVHVVQLDDARARLLAQALNRTRGADDPDKYRTLVEDMLTELSKADITAFLPETEHSIDKLIGDQMRTDANFATMPRKGPAKSKRGEVYHLGQHRLMCGDSLNPDDVAKLLGDDEPILLLADPPYGVQLDMDWRRGENRHKGGKIKTGAPATYRKAAGIMNDHRVDWSEAFALVPSITVAYVWHASSVGHRVAAGLESIGLMINQQIIWDKGGFPLSRGNYQWQHETAWFASTNDGREVPWYAPGHVPAFYAKRKGAGVPWLGGHDQTTIWVAQSPKLRSAGLGAEDLGVDHPTQKPVEIYTRPIKNHLQPGEPYYDPFAGSGTTVIAGEIAGRTCLTMELDPLFVDVIRQRYADYTDNPEHAP